jgi:hypothetical protein
MIPLPIGPLCDAAARIPTDRQASTPTAAVTATIGNRQGAQPLASTAADKRTRRTAFFPDSIVRLTIAASVPPADIA